MNDEFVVKLSQLEEGALAPAGFSHRDHVGVAMEALRTYEFFDAACRYASGLRQVTQKAGVPEKYNATVTLAFMSLIAESMTADEDVDHFLDRNRDLASMHGVIGRFGQDRLTSDLARRVALLPS